MSEINTKFPTGSLGEALTEKYGRKSLFEPRATAGQPRSSVDKLLAALSRYDREKGLWVRLFFQEEIGSLAPDEFPGHLLPIFKKYDLSFMGDTIKSSGYLLPAVSRDGDSSLRTVREISVADIKQKVYLILPTALNELINGAKATEDGRNVSSRQVEMQLTEFLREHGWKTVRAFSAFEIRSDQKMRGASGVWPQGAFYGRITALNPENGELYELPPGVYPWEYPEKVASGKARLPDEAARIAEVQEAHEVRFWPQSGYGPRAGERFREECLTTGDFAVFHENNPEEERIGEWVVQTGFDPRNAIKEYIWQRFEAILNYDTGVIHYLGRDGKTIGRIFGRERVHLQTLEKILGKKLQIETVQRTPDSPHQKELVLI